MMLSGLLYCVFEYLPRVWPGDTGLRVDNSTVCLSTYRGLGPVMLGSEWITLLCV